jgi:aryl-alcohol dehydrogenase-like predicted oxidoreductase
MAPMKRDSRPSRVREECEASLRRLRVERIDLYQFHWPDETGTPVEDSWAEMVRLVEQGKIRWLGVSNYDVALLERCEAVHHVDSLQPPFSMIRRDAGASEIPWCAAHGTGVIVYSPMQSGLLTDSFTAERVQTLTPDDWRRRFHHFQSPHLERNLTLRDSLRPIAAKHRVSVAAVAVAWTLGWRGVTGAIVGARSPEQVGARSPEQVDGWLAAADLHLDAEDLDAIAATTRHTGAGSGPPSPRGV